jgi:cell filamentation protein, protein adenylyltransferase
MDPQAFRSELAGRLIRSPVGYWAFVPHALPPKLPWTSGLVTMLSDADRALGELAGLGRSLPNPHLLMSPFAHQEAVLSSRIEGTRASLSDLYAYEAQQLALFESPQDVHEVHNYVRALEYGLERLPSLPLSLRLIREIRGRLMENVRGERQDPGEFRRSQNWIGPPGCLLSDAIFVPPPVPQMHQALNALEVFLNAALSLPPLVHLGLVHYQFEAIHPFLDGNGRMGRLLVVLLLCAWNLLPRPWLYLSAYFEAHRQEYYDLLLGVSQHGAWEAWLLFFLRGVENQSRDAVYRAGRLQALREEYRARFQAARAAARLLRLVDLLFARPVLTVRQVEHALEVDFAAAQRYVRQLEQAGLLREITGHARNRVYRADEVLSAIEGPVPEGERAGARPR